MADPTISEVNDFIAEYKTLSGYLPEWQQNHGWNWSTRWPVLNAMHVPTGELIFEINAGLTRPTISCTFRKKLVYRVDIVPKNECKYNDWGAIKQGLSALVCGPHTHPWQENSSFVEENGYGELPYRKQTAIEDALFIRALEVASKDLNIHVNPDQRVQCEPPKQASLFAEKF